MQWDFFLGHQSLNFSACIRRDMAAATTIPATAGLVPVVFCWAWTHLRDRLSSESLQCDAPSFLLLSCLTTSTSRYGPNSSRSHPDHQGPVQPCNLFSFTDVWISSITA
ncbi:hypothetical protein F444_13608 [Phytophthora nicotianae P1976]|uniref:Uncharacterized protein n=1 Tax=Phytophthora nicotianae P1976 TaxID=1317066 RepID=A0A080ZTC2_PHYNI|nr:hypothetical protein F444_13608 [Phytophthora nicotianae P1976]